MNLLEIATRELTRLYDARLFAAMPPLFAAYATQHALENSKAIKHLSHSQKPINIETDSYSMSSITRSSIIESGLAPISNISMQPAFGINPDAKVYSANLVFSPYKIEDIISGITATLDRMFMNLVENNNPAAMQYIAEGHTVKATRELKGEIYFPQITNDYAPGVYEDGKLPYGLVDPEKYKGPYEIYFFSLNVPVSMYINAIKS
jgi:hypothetical protein